MAATKRAAVYVRVSTDRQTVQNQLADLERLVQSRGYEAVIYQEVESAAKARPVLDRLLADARAGRVHAVAVWALDRLHRSMVGAINNVLELDRLGVRVISVRGELARHGQPRPPPARRDLRLGRGAGAHAPPREDREDQGRYGEG